MSVPIKIIAGSEEVVLVSDGVNYADNPVRPFRIGQDSQILWFASNSKGYFKVKGIGPNVPDILARMERTNIPWLRSRFNSPPNFYPITSYYNEIWMVAPFALDENNVISLVHNEYHPTYGDDANVYGNLIAAYSNDGATTFQFYQYQGINLPVIATPYPFTGKGKGGMFAQSNIIQWGKYYYILVEQYLEQIAPEAKSGVCLYRTCNLQDPTSWKGYNTDTKKYDIPTIRFYPNNEQPKKYLCTPILPSMYHYSWTYNVVLECFIVLGINVNYRKENGEIIEAVVYTLALLDMDTGILTPYKSETFVEYFLREIHWFDQWKSKGNIIGQAYPSILDPTSPDRNFQYSGKNPYLYFTKLHPFEKNHGRNRDVVREKLCVEVFSCVE